jgi:L-alanine-DL-glutamate epimerase-like enolase superfamily enzyme
MKIKSIKAIPIRIPLLTPYVWSHGDVKTFQNVLVEVQTDEAVTGYGESDIIYGVSYETLTTIVDVIENCLASDIVNEDPFRIERIIEVMDSKVKGNFSAKSGIEYALWDVKGKYMKQPVYNLLGGAYSDKIEVDYTLGIDTPQNMAAAAAKMITYGYNTLVVKVGRDSEKDVTRLKSVREAVGPNVNLRLDVNEGYSVDKAIRMIKKFERFDPQLVEQPVPRWDIKGMAKVARAVDTPISADEANSSPQAALQLIENDAVEILNIKPPYHGGLWNSKKVAALADASGIPIIVGGMNHFEVGRQANRHFAISTPMAFAGYAHEGPGPASQALTDNITTKTISYHDVKKAAGYVELTEEHGLGCTIDWEKVNRYTYHPGNNSEVE